MSDNTEAQGVKLAGLVREGVARGWCSPENAHKEVDIILSIAITKEVCAALNTDAIARAALEKAAKACESAAYDGTYSIDDMFEVGCLRARDYIRALANDPAALAEIVKGVQG